MSLPSSASLLVPCRPRPISRRRLLALFGLFGLFARPPPPPPSFPPPPSCPLRPLCLGLALAGGKLANNEKAGTYSWKSSPPVVEVLSPAPIPCEDHRNAIEGNDICKKTRSWCSPPRSCQSPPGRGSPRLVVEVLFLRAEDGGRGGERGRGRAGWGEAVLSCWLRRGPIQHSHFYRGGRGVALLSWWPRSGPIQHSHFYRVGRGVARATILTSTVVAAEWPDSAFSFPSWCPRNGRSPHSHFYRSGCGVLDPLILTSHFYHVSLCFSLFFLDHDEGEYVFHYA
jgi:hypothetical protein